MKKKQFQKKNLSLDCDEDEALAGSVYSEIGPDGLKFLKDNIKVSKEGLTKISGDKIESVQFLKINYPKALSINQHGKYPNRESPSWTRCSRICSGSHIQTFKYKSCDKSNHLLKHYPKSINAYDREKRHQIMNDIKILLQNKINAENNSYYCQFLVNLYGAFYDEGCVKIVLELMDAGSIGDIIRIYRAADAIPPQIPEPVLAKISQQILNGLSYLHIISHQIHRDIKPDNILLSSNGYVKLTDFGISRDLEQSAFCTTFVGTYTYMSPERIEGKKYNHLSDIWSFGIMMHELATGRYPYSSTKTYIEMLQQVVNEAPPLLPESFSKEFRDFLQKCLQQRPSQRSTAVELLVYFSLFLQIQSHPWILKNFTQTPSISQWLSYVKQNILPIASQKQQQKQTQKETLAQQFINQIHNDQRKNLNSTGQSIQDALEKSQKSDRISETNEQEFNSSTHSIRLTKGKESIMNSLQILN